MVLLFISSPSVDPILAHVLLLLLLPDGLKPFFSHFTEGLELPDDALERLEMTDAERAIEHNGACWDGVNVGFG